MHLRGCFRGSAWLAAVLLAGVLGAPAAAAAADREGEVVEVQLRQKTFTVAGGGGASLVTFRTDAGTRITFERKVVPFGNLVPGDRVSVRYRDQDLGPVATAVQIHRMRSPR